MNAPFLPTLNAAFNACAAVCLLLGWNAIHRGRDAEVNRRRHRAWMTGALAASCCFLASYLYYHLNYPAVRYAGSIRPFYLLVLVSHVVLAAVLPPFILRMVWLAAKGDYVRHARLARNVWPAWMYVSVTGILVYVMLYIPG